MEAGLYKSIVLVRALVTAAARYGVDRHELFVGTDVDPSLLADSRAHISLKDWRLLTRRAIALTGDPGLGLAIGGSVPEHMLQVVGQLAMTSDTLREAMRMFERYRLLLGNATSFAMIEEGELAYFLCAPLAPDAQVPQFDLELMFSLVYRVARRCAQLESDDAQEIWFTYPAPSYAARYAEVFHCRVTFGRPRNAILLARRYLDVQQPYADPRLADVLREGAEKMLAELNAPSLPDQVRSLLRYEVDLRKVDARHVARLLKLPARTFRRQLIEANAPWSALLNEARQRIACNELCRSDVSIREVSERLGFSEQSAFNRAFKRWTGETPARYNRAMLARAGQGGASAGSA
jgi:AraC-like DNA-binding protein